VGDAGFMVASSSRSSTCWSRSALVASSAAVVWGCGAGRSSLQEMVSNRRRTDAGRPVGCSLVEDAELDLGAAGSR